MPIEARSSSALFRRAEQLKRWEDSETNNVSATVPKDKKCKIKFSDGCVFLAACAASDTEEVERLLEKGTDINTTNVDGLTALHQACIDNNLEMVQFLVEHGCDVNRGDNEGWTPLHATASCGFISIAKYLIEHGANVAAVNNDGDLPIDIAESNEMEDYLSDVLDEQGIDCDEARSEEERIMLEDVMAMLNSQKFQDRVHPRTGATALHVAAAKGYISIMNVLIQVGADLNAQDNDGWTPLHAAAHWSQKEACALLADNLANMDIQNFAGQTCFDVADHEIVKLLEELKKKQASMQKDRPDIQAILQRTSNRPPLKRRTSVTRMSNQEKSKSVMKDTKAERVQIENLTLPEEEAEDDKERKQNETLERLSGLAKEENVVKLKKVPLVETKPSEPHKEPELERIPSWKKVLRRSSENIESPGSEVSEVTLKRPRKSEESSDKNGPSGEKKEEGGLAPLHPSSLPTEAVVESSSDPTSPTTPTDSSSESFSHEKRRPFIPPVRDDESELQRKAHAKRVRETRRSTQGVLLEDIKSAELQILINKQKQAAKRQALEADTETESFDNENKREKGKSEKSQEPDSSHKNKNTSPDVGDNQVSKTEKSKTKPDGDNKVSEPENEPSVTLVLKPKPSVSPDETGPTENRSSQGTQAAIQRRRRPKRRSTGVVYLDSDDGQEEKENTKDKDSSSPPESTPAERARHRYGSSTSIPDSASETSSRCETPSRYSSLGSRSSLNEDDNKDYKKLYEELRKENERLRESLKKAEEELEKAKKQLQKSNTSNKNSVSEAEKKEKRALERKLSELEEELKNVLKLKTENERLKAENQSLSRVVCKLAK